MCSIRSKFNSYFSQEKTVNHLVKECFLFLFLTKKKINQMKAQCLKILSFFMLLLKLKFECDCNESSFFSFTKFSVHQSRSNSNNLKILHQNLSLQSLQITQESNNLI